MEVKCSCLSLSQFYRKPEVEEQQSCMQIQSSQVSIARAAQLPAHSQLRHLGGSELWCLCSWLGCQPAALATGALGGAAPSWV